MASRGSAAALATELALGPRPGVSLVDLAASRSRATQTICMLALLSQQRLAEFRLDVGCIGRRCAWGFGRFCRFFGVSHTATLAR
jgi:hypothetical protein